MMAPRGVAASPLIALALAWAAVVAGQNDDDAGMGDMEGMGDMDDMGGMGGDYGEGDDDYGRGEEGEGGGGETSGGDAARGALTLDHLTFDKVASIPGYTLLAKFDEQYPHGEKEDEFATLCGLAEGLPTFVIGEVQVAEEEDEPDATTADNVKLSKRFGVDKEHFPAYVLLRDGKVEARYEGAITSDAISRWLRRYGVALPLLGTIPELDEAARKFIASGAKDDADIEATERLAATEQHQGNAAAPLYAKIMKKIKEKGQAYVESEVARLDKLLLGQISDAKRTELANKARILGSFAILFETAQKEKQEL